MTEIVNNLKKWQKWLPLIVGIPAIVYAVCCSNSVSDYVVSGYASACITCSWEGDGVVYLEKWNPYFICPPWRELRL